jgi:hypothetical protein
VTATKAVTAVVTTSEMATAKTAVESTSASTAVEGFRRRDERHQRQGSAERRQGTCILFHSHPLVFSGTLGGLEFRASASPRRHRHRRSRERASAIDGCVNWRVRPLTDL